MRFLIIVFLISLASCAVTPTPFGDDFDVEGGSYISYIDKPIAEEGFLLCHISARINSPDPKWAPAVVLTISDIEETISTQVVYRPSKTFHEFYFHTIEEDEFAYTNRFLRIKPIERKVFISISWDKSGKFSYGAGDFSGQNSNGTFTNSGQPRQKISVTISGVKGEIDCSNEGIAI